MESDSLKKVRAQTTFLLVLVQKHIPPFLSPEGSWFTLRTAHFVREESNSVATSSFLSPVIGVRDEFRVRVRVELISNRG